jgi:hypothetical protein
MQVNQAGNPVSHDTAVQVLEADAIIMSVLLQLGCLGHFSILYCGV